MARYIKEKQHLLDKRMELIWALEMQGYNGQDLAVIFSLNRSTIHSTLKERPDDWLPKWVKVQ